MHLLWRDCRPSDFRKSGPSVRPSCRAWACPQKVSQGGQPALAFLKKTHSGYCFFRSLFSPSANLRYRTRKAPPPSIPPKIAKPDYNLHSPLRAVALQRAGRPFAERPARGKRAVQGFGLAMTPCLFRGVHSQWNTGIRKMRRNPLSEKSAPVQALTMAK